MSEDLLLFALAVFVMGLLIYLMAILSGYGNCGGEGFLPLVSSLMSEPAK